MDLNNYIEIIEGLHAHWEPHDAQVEIGKALFNDEIKQIFGKCGRNFGKTELICYLLWRYAQSNPGSENYYFAPYAKQAREITWASRRIQTFGPRAWLYEGSRGVNNTEMRLRFTNGSFIKLDGSDNIDAYRGVKPRGLTVYDEFKDFRPEFHEAMDPNYAAHDSPLIIIGTPPEIEDHHFYHTEDEFKENDKKKFFQFTSYENPHIAKEVLDAKRLELYRRGEGDVWEREYMVKKVFGGKNSIFPMLDPKRHVRKHDELMRDLKKDMHKLQWIVSADPGTHTCFAVLFAALNPYTRKLYILDEIYETDQRQTSVSVIGKRIINKRYQLYAKADWYQCYDEAAAWFQTEMADQFDDGWVPTTKALNKKEQGLGLIKDMLLADMIIFSDRAKNTMKEMLNYIRDKNGKIPKENDHEIDNLRYILGALGYDMNRALEPQNKEEMNKEWKPWYTMDEDFKAQKDDWSYSINDEDLFDEVD